MKQHESKNQKEKYNRIERMARAQFVQENPDLKLAQDLAKTSYGKDLLSEAMRTGSSSPTTGTGADLHDEFERDGVSSKSDENIKVTPFAVAEMQAPYSTLTTARDGDGRIVEKLLHLGTIYHHVQYDYDEGGRLSRVFNDGNVIESYEYGKFGERLFADTVSFGKCQYVYDKSLKLVQAGEVKYSYDAKGRLVLKQDNGQITKYSYLPNGALHKAQLPNGRIVEYHFDSEGMRIAKSVNGTVTEKYLWKDFTTLEAVADGAAQNVKAFAYDDEGDPVAMIYNDKMYYFASDQVGSIYMVADGNGNKVEQIISDSFGNLIVDTNGAIDIPLGFAAGLLDKDTGLVHFGYREYDPEIGRFTTPDPIGFAGGDVDVYGYCWDDPNNFVDRDGLMGYVPRIAQYAPTVINALDPSRPSLEGAALDFVVDTLNNQDVGENIKKLQEGRFGEKEDVPLRTDLRKQKEKSKENKKKKQAEEGKNTIDKNIEKIQEGRFGKRERRPTRSDLKNSKKK
ncbi:RHS repeat domain-containing protein [Maridesulfovibrio frigidus]|uniref:RHS repeat domain-containing protein n=1 Tax=Maridesulfovibrio frigidus TaxID=340956 RepID=UPI00146F9DB6|nr:RHS repeat-associated core domain-containing protein [Maridesulfovibrio frigidus]